MDALKLWQRGWRPGQNTILFPQVTLICPRDLQPCGQGKSLKGRGTAGGAGKRGAFR